MLGERRTRALIGAADPARLAPPAPPRLTATDLIARAESATTELDREHGPKRRPTRRRPAGRRVVRVPRLALAAGVVAVVAVAVATVLQPAGPPPAGDPGATAGGPLVDHPRSTTGGPPVDGPRSTTGRALGPVLMPIAYQLDRNPPPAGDYLRRLARRIGPAPYDSHPGRYAYHRLKVWGDPTITVEAGYTLGYVSVLRTWHRPDDSGRTRVTELPPEFPDQASRDYFAHHPLPAGGGYAGGPFPADPNAAALPADRAGLQERLEVRYGASAASKYVDVIYSRYVVPLATRATILEILAEVPGFRWRGEVTDRAGRRGVAITYDDRENHLQTLLIFDPRTGALLAGEHLALRPVRLSTYNLILDTDRTDRIG